MISRIIILAACVALNSCKKKDTVTPPAPEPEQPAAPVPNDCKQIPELPGGISWRDSMATPGKNVNAFFYNPLNGEEVIAILDGHLAGSNRMVNINLRTRAEKHLADIDQYLPDVNAAGWIVFSSTDNNIYKVKTNGEGFTQLTNSNRAHDPKWNADGTHFYYLNDAGGSIGGRLNLANSAGGTINSWPLDLPFIVPFHKNNKIIVQESSGNTFSLMLLDTDSNTVAELLSGKQIDQSTPFRHPVLSENDEWLFWSNTYGIFRHRLSTQKTDTLFKSCETIKYDRPVRGAQNEITFSKHLIEIVEPYFLVHSFAGMEYNYVHGEVRTKGLF